MRPIVRDRILKKCQSRCINCGSINRLEVDHIIPLSRGGRHDEDNMQILCKTCNLKKGKGINFKQFFKIGISEDYILMSRDFPISNVSARELANIIENMFYENKMGSI